ncbi:MAG: hypothetical protein APF76_09595 [Desulfitibacter sp. BRH_c19]|nr:MAG: hypothetical protein APF76_09595 [Desulfitibacter sp. BRH_c19]
MTHHKVLAVDYQKCIGCRICEQWCSLSHHGVISPAKTRVNINKNEETGVNIPIICTQCSPAPCISVCPENALSKDEKTGAIRVDTNRCVACRKCIIACPNGVISLDTTGDSVLICDLCKGKPQCVDQCPTNALMYILPEIVGRERRSRIARATEKGEGSNDQNSC